MVEGDGKDDKKVRGTAPIGRNRLAPGGGLNLKDASYKHRMPSAAKKS